MKKREITSLSLLERDYRPCSGGKLRATSSVVNSLVPIEAFSGSLEVHMQPLQKITRRSVEHWTRALTALG